MRILIIVVTTARGFNRPVSSPSTVTVVTGLLHLGGKNISPWECQSNHISQSKMLWRRGRGLKREEGTKHLTWITQQKWEMMKVALIVSPSVERKHV